MIPISLYNALVVIDILLILYCVIDHQNRLYANIVISVIAAILAAFLASAATSSVVYEVIGNSQTIMNSPSIGSFLYFISTVSFIYSLFMIYEVLNEQFTAKRERERGIIDEDDF